MGNRRLDTTLTAKNDEPAPGAIAALAAGTTFGRYVVGLRLGAGGMGVVYSARDTVLRRGVALKIVRPRHNADVLQGRLWNEAQAQAQLSHPNVVQVFDVNVHNGHIFIAMELVQGESLRAWATKPRPWRDVVRLFAKAGRGLAAAHAAGLLHRDFKPDNVMVGGADEPRITDFGLAREFDEDGWSEGTDGDGHEIVPPRGLGSGSLAGTPAYMAPEVHLPQPSGPAADQFSFCVALFEVLHGVRPFSTASQDAVALVDEVRAGRIAQIPAGRKVPRRLRTIIRRGLALDPGQRWPSMAALVDALEAQLGPRKLRFYGIAGVLALVALLGLGLVPPSSCTEVSVKGNDALTLQVCKDAYARTNDPQIGIKVANAYFRTDKVDEAETLATELLSTSAAADASYTLGRIADRKNLRALAEKHLREASELHGREGRWAASANDLLVLAGVSNDVVEQLAILEHAVANARQGHDVRVEAYCYVAAANVLSRMDQRVAALRALDLAEPLMSRPFDKLSLDLQRGNVYQNLGEDALAVPAFERALAATAQVTTSSRALEARLNLAYSLAESGRLVDAATHLEAAAVLDSKDVKLAIRLSLEARIAGHAGDRHRAIDLVEQAFRATDPDEVEALFNLEVQRSSLAFQDSDFATAVTRAQRAIGLVERLRSPHPPVGLRSWLNTDHRVPYELLFASLAARGDARAALVVFDGYRGSSALAALIRGDDSSAASGIGYPAAELARLLPPLASNALTVPRSEAAIIESTHDVSLLVLVVAVDQLWRITADAGRLEVARLGAFSALRPQLARFRENPSDPTSSAALGELLVPPALARASDRALHVVLDEPLSWLPVAGLRIGGHALVSLRTVVRSARVSDLGCAAPRGRPRRVSVMGAVPATTTIPLRGVEPTRAALREPDRDDLYHVALPVERDALGDMFVLRDGRIRSLELAAQGKAPRQIVIAAATSAPAGTSSLAMALLAAGADQVLATTRPVSSEIMSQLVTRLYRSDILDLGDALARVQRTDDAIANADWLGFAVFEPANCRVE